MMRKASDCDRVARLLPLRFSEDLTDDECLQVDQHLRYCEHCQAEFAAFKRSAGVLQEAAVASLPLETTESLWKRIEPRLGPAGRLRRRPLAWISTPQLAAACVALLVLTVFLETRPQQRQPVDQPGQFAGRAPQLLTPSNPGLMAPARGFEVIRTKLGVVARDIARETQEELKLASAKGATIVEVLAGSPADGAHLRPDDVVIAVNDVEVESSAHLRTLINRYPDDAEVTLRVIRGPKQLDVTVRLSSAKARLHDLPGLWLDPSPDAHDLLLPGRNQEPEKQTPDRRRPT